MADIIIKGMEMPKTCCQCDFKIYDNEIRWDENGIEQIGAWVCKRTREIIWNTRRGENCPLVPLPEGHGRLIDADAFLATIRPLCTEDAQAACTLETVKQLMVKHISSAPTIVPAEGGTE